jgi:Flp pilus assembly protein TadG
VRTSRARRRGRGQALVELALVSPLVLLLLLGAAQIGVIVYGQVTVDTAAREGARVGSEQPNNSQAYSNGSPVAAPYPTCPSSGTSTNPVCNAVWNGAGLLSGQSMSVTIAPQSVSNPATEDSSCTTMSPPPVVDGYVQVTVTYDTPVFVPLIGQLFQTSPGHRRVSSTVLARVEPCTLTQGR